jgi:nucleoid-associated protein YgaU
MAIWDFVKDAGKSLFGSEAEAKEAPAGAAQPEPSETDRKVAALKAELQALGLTAQDVHLKLRGDTVVISGQARDQETLEKLILAVGNIKGIAHVELENASTETPAPAGAAPVFHTVQKGETLSAIAQKYLGKAGRYHEIFEANKPMLTHPDKIYPGQSLRIPQA